MANKTYCILGGGGAFAIHTALYLLNNANPGRVVGIGRNPLRPEPFTLGVEKRERYEYRTYHIWHEREELLAYLDDLQPDVIINFAAQGEGAASWLSSWRFFETNAVALSWLWENLERRAWFSQGHAVRFIHIGTSELYGSVEGPAREDAPIVPSSPYAASKAAFDLYLLAMMANRQGGRTSVILRPSNCYCSGQLLHRIIPRAIVSGLLGRKVPLHGGGRARKSYMHAMDLARAIHFVAERAPMRDVYNVGPTTPTSIRDVAEKCAVAVGVPFEDLFEETAERVGQDACYWLNTSAFREDHGWTDEVGWSIGLADVFGWAENNLDFLRTWPTDYQLRA